METVKPITPSRGRAALLATACLIASLTAGEPRSNSGPADSGVSSTNVAVEEAQVLLRKGDEAYTAARYSEAVDAYAGAYALIPNEPASAELRAATAERYAQASVEHARNLSRKGDVAGAKAVVDKVLDDAVAPKNVGALSFRAQLDDPIRTNPALTAEHGKNVDSVRRLLYTAEGAYNLGKYDESKSKYEEVLRIDPTNTAARRGMEVLASAKSKYYGSAYDQARAEMLSQVDSQWELQPPAPELDPSLTDAGDHTLGHSAVSIRAKLDRIIVPKIALDQASLQEALDFLRLRATEGDTTELDPARKGINFTVNLGPSDSPTAQKINSQRFDLRLTNVPVSQILKYITATTGTSYSTDDFSVNITPAGTASTELVSRTYRVPPDFISSLSQGAGSEGTTTADPFASDTPKQGLLAKRLGAQEALAKQGVTFPEGSSVSYIATSNTLRIVNTPTNQDYISQIIETLTKTEPMSVTVRVTMIRVEESRLEELGYDWLLDNFGFAGSGWVPGSSKLNLSGGTQGNGDSVDDINIPTDVIQRRPLTAGNRSGDSAISGNNIDSLLVDPSGRQSSSRAPGVIGVNGAVSGANFQVMMRGLDQKKGVDMMAQPSVVTRSNQESSIAIVREFIYPTEYEPPELPNDSGGGNNNNDEFFGFIAPSSSAVTPATPTAFEKEDVGITLNVLPIVDPSKNYVNVTLNPVFSDFDGFVNYGSPINKTVSGLLGPETVVVTPNEILMPVFSKQKFSTSVDVADGATLVIGGLLSESVQNVEDKTPILGDLPIFGRMFQSKAKKPTSTAIIFMINVEITDPTGRPYRNR